MKSYAFNLIILCLMVGSSAVLSQSVSAEEKAKNVTGQELSFYQSIKIKKNLTVQEEKTKTRLLNNGDVLRGLKRYLMNAPVTPEQALQQNSAIDMLFEALRFGDHETATQVLRSVVTDGQDEDNALADVTRGALKPSHNEEMANLLPGPVNQKIWKNVVDTETATQSQSASLGP